MSSSTFILERSIREWVARGAGIAQNKVIPGRHTANAPAGLYASVTLISSTPKGMVGRRQRVGSDKSLTIHSQLMDSMFDVQFYRDGALDAANRFAMFARSETGIHWAATALSCGRIAGANVYEGGSGYITGEQIEFHHHAEDVVERQTPNNAFGTIHAGLGGAMTRVDLTSGGSNYSIMPTPFFLPPTSGMGGVVSPRGFGFAVNRVKMRNLSAIESEEWEERAQIDLDVCHSVVYNDTTSGRVERIIGDADIVSPEGATGSASFDLASIAGGVDVGGLSYIYQKNLYPVALEDSQWTRSTEAFDTVTNNRLSDWNINPTVTNSTGTSGFFELDLLNEAAIAPQFGRDLIGGSPFLTNYEGSITFTIDSNLNTLNGGLGSDPLVAPLVSELAIVYLRTTHMIPGQSPNIVSTRALIQPFSRLSFAGVEQIVVPVNLNQFNSSVILNSASEGGGVIGLRLDIGFAMATNMTSAQALENLKDLNTGAASITNTPIRNLSIAVNGNNSRVTFLQHTLNT